MCQAPKKEKKELDEDDLAFKAKQVSIKIRCRGRYTRQGHRVIVMCVLSG